MARPTLVLLGAALTPAASWQLTPPAAPTSASSTCKPLSRREAFTAAGAALAAFSLGGAASAYDAIPEVQTDFAAMEKLRKERELKALGKTAELVKFLKPIEKATNEKEFIEAADGLALWVIGEGSVPEGIGIKALVARITLAYDSLPKRSYACEKTRTNGGFCYTPGKGAEIAYNSCLKELRKYSMVQLGDYRKVEFKAF